MLHVRNTLCIVPAMTFKVDDCHVTSSLPTFLPPCVAKDTSSRKWAEQRKAVRSSVQSECFFKGHPDLNFRNLLVDEIQPTAGNQGKRGEQERNGERAFPAKLELGRATKKSSVLNFVEQFGN
ncbi:hypothetical protein BH10PLA2_BH10PLA2_34520 [soil metagenome]